jgi:hypothetical protein
LPKEVINLERSCGEAETATAVEADRGGHPLGSTDESSQHSNDSVSEDRHTFRVFRPCVAKQSGDLDRGASFDGLAPSDGERASLIGPGHATRALRAVETSSFRCAECFVPELGVSNVRIANCDEHLPRDAKYVEFVVWKDR